MHSTIIRMCRWGILARIGIALSVLWAVASAGAVLPVDSPRVMPKQRVIPSSYIVVYRNGVASDTVSSELAARFGLKLNFSYRHALRGAAVTMASALVEKVLADPRVAYIEPDVERTAATQILPMGIDVSMRTWMRRLTSTASTLTSMWTLQSWIPASISTTPT